MKQKPSPLTSQPVVMAILVGLACVLFPGYALALQTHGPPEGLYVHQMAHIHFICALGYLYWDIRRSSFVGKGWRYLLLFCAIMTCWNILAFIGHAVTGSIQSNSLTAIGGYLQGRVEAPLDATKIIFYITKFDHVLAVPALFFLFV